MSDSQFIFDAGGQPFFDWAAWRGFRENRLFKDYPATPAHARVELALIHPHKCLKDVPVPDNPHVRMGNGLGPHVCFYVSNHWSTIFDVYSYVTHSILVLGVNHGVKLIAESDHHEPVWGERLCLMSTADDLFDCRGIRFAYFRDQYWWVHGFVRQTLVRDYASLSFPLPLGGCEIPTLPQAEFVEEEPWLGERRRRVIELDSSGFF